jgi:hypothetical protein
VGTTCDLVQEAMPDLQLRRQDAKTHESMDSMCQVWRVGNRTTVDARSRLPGMQRTGHALVVEGIDFGAPVNSPLRLRLIVRPNHTPLSHPS